MVVILAAFWGPHPDAELFVRWVQNGVFQPRFPFTPASTDNTVTEPWMYQEYTPLIRETINLRYRLMPYFYSLMRQLAHQSGHPIMRPTFARFQHDCTTYDKVSILCLVMVYW